MDHYLQELQQLIDFSKEVPIQQAIYDGMREWIINGSVPLGYRLNEVHLSKTLNISRTPIRDAIKQLTFEGLLESKQNVGTMVRKVAEQDVLEVYKLRVSLETLSFTNAMTNMTDQQFDQLNALLDETALAHQQGDSEKVVELSKEFNNQISAYAAMPRLESLLRNLKDYIHRFRFIAMTSPTRGATAIEEHKLIVRAMRNRNEEQIKAVVEEHLKYSLLAILGYLHDEQNESKSTR